MTRYGVFDPAAVDRMAVEFTCQGTKMPLDRASQHEAAHRMCGFHPTFVIAERIGATDKQVVRILSALGAVKCPVCLQLSIVEGGVYRRHFNSHSVRHCPMSGQPAAVTL